MPLHDDLHGDRSPLTRQQQTILDAIAFFHQKGELPTVREVGALVGLRSPSTVLKHLRALEKQGLLTISGKSRGIRLTAPLATSLPTSTHVTSKQAASKQAASKRSPRGALHFGGPIPMSALLGSATVPTGAVSGRTVPIVGAIAAGRPFESYSDAFVPGGVSTDGSLYCKDAYGEDETPSSVDPSAADPSSPDKAIPIDPRIFVDSGDVFALQVHGESMINAGILDGDYVIIRRQNTVEEGEIAAVIINGEGTLKRWRTVYSENKSSESNSTEKKTVALMPANERFDPIEITEEDAKDVLVFGKYVGLVRGNLRVS